MPNKYGRFATDFVRHFLFYKIQCCSIYLNKISFKFTDKAGFLERLSVKLGSKLPKSYGQTAIFNHFVRNRYFSSSPFTDKISIFIDVSVNDSDFVKCNVC
ncbi:Hypothetical protein LRC_08790 [Ligilactobacillus ruminis ATCC 27782]|uniref:Uncharacterized protein n=1 Tax=Ligilactobacillus ruminis (strain ATCC 27782 / RF3) TaxID=1069534 RepID=G2SNJ7_LIGR2|nr:Hypothetical protein LRC_08790 [Ligilactobacillus ruminis ATCC 27782]